MRSHATRPPAPARRLPGREDTRPAPARVSRIAERIQRITADENPFEEDAVVAEGAAASVRTLRAAAEPSGEAGISRSALRSGEGGSPLPPTVRQFMEPRFGADFGGVRVHADGRAAELATSVSARAFAYGKHLYFNEGEYQPGTDGGKRVLAHELAHVVQQGGDEPTTVRRLSPLGPALQHGVAPWGSGPIGSNHEVTTDAGNPLTGWRGYRIFPYEKLFWCHGHSLGTMPAFGYSIYSGAPLATVLADEWNPVPEDQTRSGDIAVWTTRLNHSAIVSTPVLQGGQLDHAQTELSTKNGQRPVATMTLDAVEAIYGTGVEIFRRK